MLNGGGDSSWTVEDLANSIKRDWSFPDHWFFWPPDVFAFTSTVFQETGCYSQVLSEIPESEQLNDTNPVSVMRLREWHGIPQWQDLVEETAGRWLSEINNILLGEVPYDGAPNLSDFLKADGGDHFFKVVESIGKLASKVALEDLRLLTGKSTAELRNAQTLCKELIFVHAVADEACSGFGLPNAPPPDHAMAQYLGNLLLTSWGSLSSLPKHHGIVLPKMRTPQSGLTLRSLSHHLTFHRSEVEVMWRATPWVNVQENTLNILCLPWPFKVETQCFNPGRETFESVRYFSYAPPQSNDPSYLDDFVELACRAEEMVGRLHMLVFPETALISDHYRELMRRLREAHRRPTATGDVRLKHVPMIVAGVLDKVQEEEEFRNEVRLSAYFAGRWYELSQRKHHKWKLDHHQIRQYDLQGRLSTVREWYENISIAQRRLTFLAPNDWLTLCPLICEDLAQLEPVSDLIRGVGPTLLLALLLDGPQVKERWPARYASVFADDPGIAVLTLTSLGMATRSHRLDGGKPNEKPSRAVGLWRDLIRGWETLELGKDEHAHLLTISADWTEEYTADGRTDHGFASAFKFEGTQQFSLSRRRNAPDQKSDLPQEQWLRGWGDIRELTAATYALDAAMQLEDKHLDIIYALLLTEDLGSEFKDRVPLQILELTNLLTTATRNPAGVGVAAQPIEDWPSRATRLAASELRNWLSDTTKSDGKPVEEFLTEKAINQLEANNGAKSADGVGDDEEWSPRSVSIAILAALHYRITRFRRRRSRQHGAGEKKPAADGSLTFSEAANLLQKIEDALEKYA